MADTARSLADPWTAPARRPVAVVQRPHDLVLAVTSEPPDPAPPVLAEAIARHLGVTARFQVISASHLVLVEPDDRPGFCEMLSCATPLDDGSAATPLAGSAQAGSMGGYRHSFADLADHEFAIEGYRVEVHFRTHPLKPSGTARPAGPQPDTLQIAFPTVFGQQPLTRVSWKRRPGLLTWTTLHTYPHPDGVTEVVSRSVLATPDGATATRARR